MLNSKEEKAEQQRTADQNRALHKYFQMLADMLNDAGLDMRKVLKPSIDIPWSKQTIKDYLWRPIQEAQLGKESTTEMNTKEVNKVFETLNRHLGLTFGVHIPFPSIENLIDYENDK